MLSVGGLFSGIGGFELGLHRAGMQGCIEYEVRAPSGAEAKKIAIGLRRLHEEAIPARHSGGAG